MRGASWNNNNPKNFRGGNRNNNNPQNRNNNNGLRSARTWPGVSGVPAANGLRESDRQCPGDYPDPAGVENEGAGLLVGFPKGGRPHFKPDSDEETRQPVFKDNLVGKPDPCCQTRGQGQTNKPGENGL